MKRYFSFALILTLLTQSMIYSQAHLTFETLLEESFDNQSCAELVIHISPDTPIIASSLSLASESPIQIGTKTFSSQPTYRNGIPLFTSPVTVTYTIHAHDQEAITSGIMKLHYDAANDSKQVTHELVLADNFKFKTPQQSHNDSGVYFPVVETNIDTQTISPTCPPQEKSKSWSESLSWFILHTDSLLVRLLLVLLLGLLMSLTPCIYPMIPITAGILQSQGSKSFARNIALSCAYTCGIAITFALLGLTAAYTGQLFGSILANPFVIGAIVLFLGYLALSMMGIYEMYIPKFMQPRHQTVKQGSLLSAFIFGAASGTFASPCLSPGLLLLLTLVTSLQNAFLGFLLLFVFGIGLSIPLLIVGSFSSSISMLPRAGMWMVEVKKLFGVLMLIMCLYFLAYILTQTQVIGVAALLFAALAFWFYRSVNPYDKRAVIVYKYIFALASIYLSAYLFAHAYNQKKSCPIDRVHTTIWQKDLDCAIEKAQKEGKNLFIDIGAPFCSICKAIDKKLFEHEQVECALKQFVVVKIDGSDEKNKAFIQAHSVKGFPTILITDSTGTTEFRRWGAELYNSSPKDFIEQLNVQSH